MEYDDILSIVKIRIIKAKETIEDARLALESNRFRNALNRIYYAIFYMISALSVKNGYSTSKHKQLMGWFIKNFVSTGKIDTVFSNIYKRAFDRRQESDYDDVLEFDKVQVELHFKDMLSFVTEIEKLIEQK
ncbi:MAG: HEPN domain-containing protein [Bacteroidetes bacterium]|nr:HEPN domain-containing protein [Bacteroidota bacterium]